MGGVERGEPHQPVDALFRVQVAVGIGSVDRDGHAFDPGFFAGRDIQDFGLVMVQLAPAQVHALQHVGPILGIGAACPGVDRQQGVSMVVLAGEHQFELAPVDFGFGLGGFAFQLAAQAFIFQAGQLQRIGDALLQALPVFHFLAQPGQLFHHHPRPFRVVPQLRVFRLFLKF